MRWTERDRKTGDGIRDGVAGCFFFGERCQEQSADRIPGIFVQHIKAKRKKKHVKERCGAVLRCAFTAGKHWWKVSYSVLVTRAD